MLVLCDDQIRALHMQLEIAQMGGLRGALAAQKSVKDDAEAFLKEKSSSELVQLKATIESKLKDSASHDTEFMEEVSLLLQSFIAASSLSSPSGSQPPLCRHRSRARVRVIQRRPAAQEASLCCCQRPPL